CQRSVWASFDPPLSAPRIPKIQTAPSPPGPCRPPAEMGRFSSLVIYSYRSQPPRSPAQEVFLDAAGGRAHRAAVLAQVHIDQLELLVAGAERVAVQRAADSVKVFLVAEQRPAEQDQMGVQKADHV